MTSFLTAGFVYLCPVSQFRLEMWAKTGEKVGVRGAPSAPQSWPGITCTFKLTITALPLPPLPLPFPSSWALSYFSSSRDEFAWYRSGRPFTLVFSLGKVPT